MRMTAPFSPASPTLTALVHDPKLKTLNVNQETTMAQISPAADVRAPPTPEAVVSASSTPDSVFPKIVTSDPSSSSSSSPTSSLSPTSSAERRSLRRRDSKTTFFETLDQLLKLQGSRMDDQRAEFNPNLRKKSSSNPSSVQTRFEIAALLERKGPYPQVVLPKCGGYLLEECSSEFLLNKDDIFVVERDQTSTVYRDVFWDRHHFDYYGNDDALGDIVISVKPRYENVNRCRFASIDDALTSTRFINDADGSRNGVDRGSGGDAECDNCVGNGGRFSTSSLTDTLSPTSSSSTAEYHVIVRTKSETQYEVVPQSTLLPPPPPLPSPRPASSSSSFPNAKSTEDVASTTNQNSSSSSSSPSATRLLATAFPALSEVDHLTPILTFEASRMLLDYDEHNRSANYKFGVILQRGRQLTEEEMFNNCVDEEEAEEEEERTEVVSFERRESDDVAAINNGVVLTNDARNGVTPSYGVRNGRIGSGDSGRGGSGRRGKARHELLRFMDLMADRVRLRGFGGFRGGLDVTSDHTGNESYYARLRDGREIMFHVSTLLPYLTNDKQQLQRKRHVGNDMVCVVFQEENTPFSPDMIASHFLQVFVVVQPVDDGLRYRISVTRRADVPDFPPSLPVDGLFERDDEALGEWLLAKLINAEHACYGTKKLSEMQSRTRATLFEALTNDLRAKNESFLEETSLANAANGENNSNKKTSKKEKESKKTADKEKSRKKSKVKATKSLGGANNNNNGDDNNSSTNPAKPERKTRSFGEMLTPLTPNFISYSNPNTPQPHKRSSNEDGGSLGGGDVDGTLSNASSTPRLTFTRQQRSLSRVRRVPISTRTSGIVKPVADVDLFRVVNVDADAHSSPADLTSKEEASLEDEAISIQSNNSEYSCSDDNAAFDLSDDVTHRQQQQQQQQMRRQGRGEAVSPVQSAASSSSVSLVQPASSNSSTSRLYLDYHLQRNKIQSLSMRKSSYHSWGSGSVADESFEDGHNDNNNDGGGGRAGEEAMRSLMAENKALKKQLEQLQANQVCQAHNYSILSDLSLKQTTV